MKQNLEKKIAKYCVKTLGKLYLKAEKYLDIAVEEVAGVKIDNDLQKYNRQELCNEFDKYLKLDNGCFYSLSSTSKIRLGMQILRETHVQLRSDNYISVNNRVYEKVEKSKVDGLENG